MSYGYMKEDTASLWMNIDNTSNIYPDGGQGASLAAASKANSLVAGASASKPVILEAVEVYCPSTAGTISIRNYADNTDIFTINVSAKADTTQWFPLGGPYGVQVNQGFGARVSNTTNLTNVKIYFRY